MEGSRWEAPEGGGGERKSGGERAGRCEAEGAAEGPRRDPELRPNRTTGPRGARSYGRSRQIRRCPLGLGSHTYSTCPPAARRGRREGGRTPQTPPPAGAGPHCQLT